MGKTAYVTGSTGFLGLNLVEELILRGWRVVALHRANSELKYLKRLRADPAIGDITDLASLKRTLPRNVDAVFHVAGSTNLWAKANLDQSRINIDGTRNVVEAALECGAGRLVHTSTISVYGIQAGRIDERAKQQGRSSWINYQRSKFFAEEEVRKGIGRGLDAVILNPGSIIGRYDQRNWARMIMLTHAGKLPGVPPGAVSFCHAGEVARAHIAAAERGTRGANYLLGGADASFLELVRIIGMETGKPVPSEPTAAWLLRLAARVAVTRAAITGEPPSLTPEMVALVTRNLHCDCTKAMRELGYRPVALHVMVAEACEWLKKEGFLTEVT